jgi:transmembrane sensor
MITKEILQSLMQAYQNGSLTDAQQKLWSECLHDRSLEPLWLDLMEADMLQDLQVVYQHPKQATRLEAGVWERIDQKDRKIKRISMRRWIAAASIFIGISVSCYLFWMPRGQNNPSMVRQLSASGQIILELADGSTIVLDSTKDQVIETGDIRVTQKKQSLAWEQMTRNSSVKGLNTIRTPRGAQFEILLPDGSKVFLNSATKLVFPNSFEGTERIVHLEGQAYFDIKGNAQQPFIVQLDDHTQVQVLGTSFDIQNYPDEEQVHTTLISGSVQVLHDQKITGLKPGQQATLSNASGNMNVKTVAIENIIAWKNGMFIFNQMDLKAILREVARWYDVEIKYQGAVSSKLYGGGISRSMNLQEVLHFLQETGSNHFKIENNTIIVN